MPIYEFECRSCGNQFEHMQPFSATTTPSCASCGGSDVVRHLSRPAIHFKGSGWYVTDSKKNGKAASANGADKDSTEKGTTEKGVTSSAEKSSDVAAETKSTGNKPAAESTAAAPVTAD